MAVHCTVCGGEKVQTTTILSRTRGGAAVRIHGVPVERCVHCGEEWFRSRVIKQVDRLMARHPDSRDIRYEAPDSEWAPVLRKMARWPDPAHQSDPVTLGDLPHLLVGVR